MMATDGARADEAGGDAAAEKSMEGEENTIAVFVVAQSMIARAGLEAVLTRDGRLVVAGSAAEISAAPFDFSGERESVDVILANVEREKDFDDLLDVLSDGASGEIDSPPVVVLLPVELQSSEYVSKALRNGVRGVLPHDASADEIAAIVRAAANGLISFAPEFADALLSVAAGENALSGLGNGNRAAPFETELIEHLTARETEILALLGDGASNKAIAYQLNISEHTVKFHVASIFGKLNVNTRTEAVTVALKRGLILL